MSFKFYIYLGLVLTVIGTGVPIDSISNICYEITKFIGVDIPMTPLTSDMAMMSDSVGETSYEKKLKLIIKTDKDEITLDETKLRFYQEKIPLHLFFEIISYEEYSLESKKYLCQKFKDFFNSKITYFELQTNKQTVENKRMGFNRKWVCNE